MTSSIKKSALAVAITLILSPVTYAGIGDGLLGYWPLNGDANDISGKKNNGSGNLAYTQGAIPWDAPNGGRMTKYAEFSGTPSHIVVTEVATLATSTALRLASNTPFSLSAWMSLGGEMQDGEYTLVNKPGWKLVLNMAGGAGSVNFCPNNNPGIDPQCISAAPMRNMWITYDANSNGQIDGWDEGGYFDVPVIVPPAGYFVEAPVWRFVSKDMNGDGQTDPEEGETQYSTVQVQVSTSSIGWVQVLVTYGYDAVKKVGTANLYLNGGSPVATMTPFASPSAVAGNLVIGKNSQTDTNYFVGAMDDVRIYNRVLTPDEVMELAKGCKAATYDPKTGRLSMPCVSVAGNPGVFQVDMMQQPQANFSTPVTFAVTAVKSIISTLVTPELPWGNVAMYMPGGAYSYDWAKMGGQLHIPTVKVTDPIAPLPATQCYNVFLDEVFTSNKFMLRNDPNYLGPNCNNFDQWVSQYGLGEKAFETQKPPVVTE